MYKEDVKDVSLNSRNISVEGQTNIGDCCQLQNFSSKSLIVT